MTSRYRLAVVYSVPDFERWAEVMRTRTRRAEGIERMTVYRSTDDPTEVMVELHLRSSDDAKDFVGNPRLRAFFDRAGVEVYPPVFVGELVDALSTDGHGDPTAF